MDEGSSPEVADSGGDEIHPRVARRNLALAKSTFPYVISPRGGGAEVPRGDPADDRHVDANQPGEACLAPTIDDCAGLGD